MSLIWVGLDGGAADLLHDLAQVYIGPGTVFPPMPNPPAGVIAHYRPTKITGIGNWASSVPPGGTNR